MPSGSTRAGAVAAGRWSLELGVVDDAAVLLDLDVEEAHPLLRPGLAEVVRLRGEVDLLARVAGALDADDVVAPSAPVDRRLADALQHRRLPAQEIDQDVARHRDGREARDVAGAGGADVEALVTQVGEREA